MNKNYSGYLFYLLILIIFLLTVFFLIRTRKKRKAGEEDLAVQNITGGNISIFFDKSNNVTIIPYAKDKYGVGRAVGEPLFLNWPFNAHELGGKARNAMNMCSEGVPSSNEHLMHKLGYKDWKDFSKGRRNISVHYHKDHGVVLNTTIRMADGVYKFNRSGFENIIGVEVKDKQLGEILLALLPRCRD